MQLPGLAPAQVEAVTNGEHAASCVGSPATDRPRPPLAQPRVDELVRGFHAKHLLWRLPVGKRDQPAYAPSRMPAYPLQNAADARGLQRQAEVHQNVASLLTGFAFAATASEGLLTEGLDEGYRGSTMEHVDQAIFLLLCVATIVLLSTVMHFMYIDMGIGTRAGSLYAQAYSGKLGQACVTFHVGTVLLAAVMPLWAYRKFELSWVFYACCALPPGWMYYDFGVSLPAHMELNQLLAHAELGLEVAICVKIDEFCIKNDGFLIQYDEFCI